MSVNLRGTATAASSGATSSGSASVAFTVPAGVQNGDLWVLEIGQANAGIITAPDATFLLIGQKTNSTVNQTTFYVRPLTTADVGTTFTFTLASAVRWTSIAAVFSGVDVSDTAGGSYLSSTMITHQQTTSLSRTSSDISPTKAGLLVWGHSERTATGIVDTAFTADATDTLAAQITTTSSSTNTAAAMYYATISGAGATGVKTATANYSNGATVITFTLAAAPVPASLVRWGRAELNGTVAAVSKVRWGRAEVNGTATIAVNVLQPVTVEPETVVSYTATLQGGGTATSWAWRVVSGPPVALTANGATVSFRAPSAMPPGTAVVLGVTATASAITSPEQTVTVTALPQLRWFYNAGTFIGARPLEAVTVTAAMLATSRTRTTTASGTVGAAAPTPTLARRVVGVDGSVKVTTTNAVSVRIKASTDAASSTGVIYSAPVTPDSNGVSAPRLTGGIGGVRYYYRIAMTSASGVETLDSEPTIGRIRVAPTGAANFAFNFGSCCNAADSASMAAIAARGDDLFFHLGDLWYSDGSGVNLANYLSKMSAKTDVANHKAVMVTTPGAYAPSDHDSSMTNNGNAGTNATALSYYNQAYRRLLPTPAEMPATNGIYYSFMWGRVLFVNLDCRSFATIPSATDNSSKTLLGATQKAWLKTLTANTSAAVICMIGDTAWNGAASAGDDAWIGYTTERSELLAHFATTGKNFCYLSGDMHAVAYDNGTLNNGSGGMVSFAAAPLNNAASQKAGPWSALYPTSGSTTVQQYGRVAVTDTGTAITFAYTGYSSDNTARVTYSKTWTTTQTLTWAPPTLVNPVTLNVSATNKSFNTLDPNTDYILKMPNSVIDLGTGRISITGGRNVVMIGGEITGTGVDGSIRATNQSGTLHIEGLLISGNNLAEGIQLQGEVNATVQLQNIRIERLFGSYEGHHADLVQWWNGGPKILRIDRFTGTTQYQGMMMQDFGTIGPSDSSQWDFRRINIHHEGTAGWVFFDAAPEFSQIATSGIYVEGGTDSVIYSLGHGNLQPGVFDGNPPGGDYVTAASVGLNYPGR